MPYRETTHQLILARMVSGHILTSTVYNFLKTKKALFFSGYRFFEKSVQTTLNTTNTVGFAAFCGLNPRR